MTNLVVGVGSGPVRPYVVGGVGLVRSHVSSLTDSVTGIGDTDSNALGYDLGFGLTGMFGRHIGIRGDIRNFHTFQDINLFIVRGRKLRFLARQRGPGSRVLTETTPRTFTSSDAKVLLRGTPPNLRQV